MITMKEIAKACGVSVATVSYILNNKGKASEATARKVLQAAKDLNYVPNAAARQLKTKKARSIGVIVEDMTIFSIPDIVDGITDCCDKMEYQILLINLRLFKRYNDTYYYKKHYYKRVKEEILKLVNKQVEGIIYVTAHERVLSCIPENLSVPAVMAYGYTNSNVIPSIVVDDKDGGYRITRLLLEAGHERIGVITGKADSLHAKARLEGYKAALEEYHLAFDHEIIKFGDWNRHSGYDYTDELLSDGVSAIFCMNDLMAGGVYDRLEERGLIVGKDLSVVGYDGRMLSAYYKPPLTTVLLPLHDIGYEASEVLISMLKGEWEQSDQPKVYSVGCHLINRDSVNKK